MQSGKLNRRIIVEQVTESQDASGFPGESWATYCKRWASVIPIGGIFSREEFAARKFETKIDAVFLVRYDSVTAAITPKMRISYNSKTYDIQSVFDVNEAHGEIEILAYEVQ
jgi:SPP1 family predicted phage head-tail adaptor